MFIGLFWLLLVNYEQSVDEFQIRKVLAVCLPLRLLCHMLAQAQHNTIRVPVVREAKSGCGNSSNPAMLP